METSTQLPLDLFINHISDALIICNTALRITRWNTAAEEIYGWTAAEAMGQHIDELLRTDWIKTAQSQALEELMEYGVWRGEILQYTKDDKHRFIWSTVTWLRDESGVIIGGVAINRDMTNERLMEARFRKERDTNANIEKAMRTLFHDMRIPLTVIGTSAGIISRYEAQLSAAERKDKLTSIQAQIRRLGNLIDEASLIIRGNIKERVYDPRKLNIRALCEASLNEINISVASPAHKLFLEADPTIQFVKGDETLISRILLNLLSNAVKYSPKGGEITLRLYRFENSVILEVKDTGLGIAEEDQAHIFESFYRSQQVKNITGSGLGLNIVRECVHAHLGSITVFSKLGQGSTFIVALPYQPVDTE